MKRRWGGNDTFVSSPTTMAMGRYVGRRTGRKPPMDGMVCVVCSTHHIICEVSYYLQCQHILD